MMSNNNELLPCPFCGSKDVHVEMDYRYFFVACHDCSITISNQDTLKEATDKWNDRALPESSEYQRGYLQAKKDILFNIQCMNSSEHKL